MAYRTDATELGDARRRVETLVARIPDGRDSDFGDKESGNKGFDEPWELRAFAMAVAAYDNGCYEWSEFQLSLIESIRTWEVDPGDAAWSYYEHWLAALENVLAKNGALSEAKLDDLTNTILTIPKDANHHEAHREPVAIDPAR